VLFEVHYDQCNDSVQICTVVLTQIHSSVSIAMGRTIKESGFHSQQSQRTSVFALSRPALGHTQPFIQWVHRALSLKLEADYSI
jgi:hypothetical protein